MENKLQQIGNLAASYDSLVQPTAKNQFGKRSSNAHVLPNPLFKE